MSERREIKRLTEQLVAGERQREQAADREREEAARRKQESRERRAAEITAGLEEVASLAPELLRDRQEGAELIRIPHTRRAGLFRDRHKTEIERVPAWEVAAGTGVEISHWKEGVSEHEWNYRVMLTADGRVVIGASPHDFRDAKPPCPSSYRQHAEPLREKILSDCGIATRRAIAGRVEELRAGSYSGPLWGEVWNPPQGRF